MTRTQGTPAAWCALAAAACLAVPRPLASQAAPPPATTAAYQVAGVRVIHRRRPASEVVAARLFLLGGTQLVTEETQGIEALLLEAAESGTRRALARVGAQTVIDAGPDWTVTGIVTLREDFAAAWDVFAGWFGPALPADSAVERARNRLLTAARRRLTHPDLRIWSIARASAFAGHPYAFDPEGTEQSLAAITTADLEDFRAERLVRSRLLLVVVGDVPRAEVESLVVRSLGRLPEGAYAWTAPPPITRQQTRWLAEQRRLATNYILGWFVGPAPADDDYIAFELATYLLSARLHRTVRSERSLSYAAYAPFMDRAIPVGGLYASSADPGRVFELMVGEVRQLRATAVPMTVLRDFQSQFALRRLAGQMTNERQAEALGEAALLFGDHRMADERWERLRRVSPEMVRRAAEQYMRYAGMAYLGDTTLMSGKW